jgi:hypothetical protein
MGPDMYKIVFPMLLSLMNVNASQFVYYFIHYFIRGAGNRSNSSVRTELEPFSAKVLDWFCLVYLFKALVQETTRSTGEKLALLKLDLKEIVWNCPRTGRRSRGLHRNSSMTEAVVREKIRDTSSPHSSERETGM